MIRNLIIINFVLFTLANAQISPLPSDNEAVEIELDKANSSNAGLGQGQVGGNNLTNLLEQLEPFIRQEVAKQIANFSNELRERIDEMELAVLENSRRIEATLVRTNEMMIVIGNSTDLKDVEKVTQRSHARDHKDILEKIIFKARARVYSNGNVSGDFEDYNFDGVNGSSCFLLSQPAPGAVRSLDTFGTCIRLYTGQGFGCRGSSYAYYPRLKVKGHDDEGDKVLEKATFISPCFDNELNESLLEFELNSTQKIVKGFKKLTVEDDRPFVPDLISFIGFKGDEIRTSGSPIQFYKTGYGGRVEYIFVEILQKHLKSFPANNSSKPIPVTIEDDDLINFYGQLDQEDGDSLGHFISYEKFGWQENLPFYPIFSQSSANKILMGEMEEKFENFLKLNPAKWVQMFMNVYYGIFNSTRPIGMTSSIYYYDEKVSRVYLHNFNGTTDSF